MEVYPFKFRPIYKQRIWGGQKLREFFGKDIRPGEKIGESWELADLPNNKSVISNGELAEQSLNEVIEKYPKEITGDADFRGRFPLLVKFLDAEDILSVQVHPDEQTCKKMGTGEPKTECWYIIWAEDKAFIYKGLEEGVTKQRFAEAIEKGTVADMLQKVPVKKGQCHFLPAGTAHAIGPGLLIAEIQTPSDTTYRVFDWNRVDETGKPRQLHIKQAMESIHFGRSADNLPVTTAGRLVDCEYFTIDKDHDSKEGELLISAGQLKIMIFLSGEGVFFGKNKSYVDFRAGDCILVPADCSGMMKFMKDTEYLKVMIYRSICA